MDNISQRIAHLLKPPSHRPSLDTGATSDSAISTIPASKTCSSCELFGMFKLLAAGKPKDEDIMNDIDVEVDEDEHDEASSSASETATATASVDRPASESTVVADGEDAFKDHHSQQEALRRWQEEIQAHNQVDRDADGAKLAALSLNNLSLPEEQATDAPRPRKREPTASAINIPGYSSLNAGLTQEIQDRFSQPSREEKLKAIQEDFGDIAGLMENLDGSPSSPEELLAETHGSLFKGVMLIGKIHLTTHRLLFHALLPPDSAYTAQTDEGSSRPDVIHSGPITIHKSGLASARRVWMELGAEMATTYPRADEKGRVRPLRCILTSTIHRLEPYDSDHPLDFHLGYEGVEGPKRIHFSVDTEQSAIQWRRAFENVLFRHARTRWRANQAKRLNLSSDLIGQDEWTTMRVCIPLDRIAVTDTQDYHSFCTLVSLDIDLGVAHSVWWLPEDVARGNYSGDHDTTTADAPRPRSNAASAIPPPVASSTSPPATPTRQFSLRSPLKGVSSPPRTRDSSPVGRQKRTLDYLDTAVNFDQAATIQDVLRSGPQEAASSNIFPFNLGVLNDQVWFVQTLQDAVQQSRSRRYKATASRPKMVLNIGGYDCLEMDDEAESGRQSTSSSDIEREETMEAGNALAFNAQKLERAAMAAKVFGLKEEDGIWLKRCYVATGIVPARGHLIVTPRFICFWRRATVGHDIKYRFATSDVKTAEESSVSGPAPFGMKLQVAGQHDLGFGFWHKEARDEAIRQVRTVVSAVSSQSSSKMPTPISSPGLQETILGSDTLVAEPTKAKKAYAADILALPKEALSITKTFPDGALLHMPFVVNHPGKPHDRLSPRTFAMLTIGSRGDVQPYIALGIRLMRDGHKVVIITHNEFKNWIEGYGIEHRQAGGDPTALMKLSEEHKMFSPGFFKESLGSYRTWLDDLLRDSWEACHDVDVLIESPSAMAGIHIAEARKIPYFRAFTMPWTRTSAYPQAFMVPAFEMGPSFNYSTYVLFDNIIWRATSGQINRWRKKYLKLKPTDMSSLSITKVPFLYNFSSAVVPKPLDWHDDITITGYWTLENSDTDWTPPDALAAFIKKARDDGRPLVYIGFGSIVVPKPNAMTKSIIKAVEKADVRAIIAKGWSSRGGDPASEGADIELPENCYGLDKVPHGWLFPQVDAALHHGGAGTVGASLRAGIPTLIKPWFGDQYFWATRVTKLEVGLKVNSLRWEELAEALTKATTSRLMIEKAKRVGELIRAEDGVDNAVRAIHYNIVRAASDRRTMSYRSK